VFLLPSPCVSCVSNVANVSGLSIFDCPFGFLLRLIIYIELIASYIHSNVKLLSILDSFFYNLSDFLNFKQTNRTE
jgi:hypothetical protein